MLAKCGVGQKKKNNVVVIGIAPTLRKITIRNVYGIEKKMTDNETKLIIDSMILSFFKQANYFEGNKRGLMALLDQIK